MGKVVQLPKKQYRVTITESTVVQARSEDEALLRGKEFLAYFGADTQDVDVEEVEE